MREFHIQYREKKNVTVLTTLLDQYLLRYLHFPFPLLSCPLPLPFTLVSVFTHLPLCLSSPYSVSSLYLYYFFCACRRGKFRGKKCIAEDTQEKRGIALEREEERRWREKTSNC